MRIFGILQTFFLFISEYVQQKICVWYLAIRHCTNFKAKCATISQKRYKVINIWEEEILVIMELMTGQLAPANFYIDFSSLYFCPINIRVPMCCCTTLCFHVYELTFSGLPISVVLWELRWPDRLAQAVLFFFFFFLYRAQFCDVTLRLLSDLEWHSGSLWRITGRAEGAQRIGTGSLLLRRY